MNIIVVHDNGFSVDNNSTIKEIFNPSDDGKSLAGFDRYIHPMSLFDVIGNPSKDCQVLTDTNKGFFCIFESNKKIKAIKTMSQEEITQLKNNLKKWQ